MSKKFGHCDLCPKDSPEKRLYGGLCAYHLNHAADDHSKQKANPEKVKEISRVKTLNEFYREQWARMPRFCENGCKTRLLAATIGKAKFFICHIVPKKNFESVMVHPANIWFGCWQCHQDYDSSWAKAVTMPVWPLVAERFTTFMNLIKDTELQHLPDAFRVLMGDR